MPATLTTQSDRLTVAVPRGPDGLWNALVRSKRQHTDLPVIEVRLDPAVQSMFAYDPAEATPIDSPAAGSM